MATPAGSPSTNAHDVTIEASSGAVSRTRRAFFVFGFTAGFTLVAAALAFLGYDTPLARTLVDGLMGLNQMMIIFYLSTSTIDRSEILTNIGKGMGEKRNADTPAG